MIFWFFYRGRTGQYPLLNFFSKKKFPTKNIFSAMETHLCSPLTPCEIFSFFCHDTEHSLRGINDHINPNNSRQRRIFWNIKTKNMGYYLPKKKHDFVMRGQRSSLYDTIFFHISFHRELWSIWHSGQFTSHPPALRPSPPPTHTHYNKRQ